MPVLLALVSAAAFGISDFVGGWETRRSPAAKVTFVSSIGGLGVALLVSLIVGGNPTVSDIVAGLVAGIGGGLGLMLLYSSLARGPIGIAAPVSAVLASVVPFAYGLASGERPPLLAIVGSVMAVGAIPLITWEPRHGRSETVRRTVLEAMGAGVGFGVFFIAIAQAADTAGLWPLVGARIMNLVLMAGLVLTAGAGTGRVIGKTVALIAGAVDMGANVAFVLAERLGDLSTVAVVTNLYPIGTVALARVVLGERFRRLQIVGVVIALAGTALIAS